jgi:S-adenosylmethionine hydrolase
MLQKKREKRSGIVTLITDFGEQAEYAGAMKGAILRANPRCQVVDITHQIPPQDILRAAFVLENSYPYYPEGTVHLAVVDPGVGTKRRPLALKKGGHLFVGPDNGVFAGILSVPGEGVGYEITRRAFFREAVSMTFHGRDLFGPVAGSLAAGLPLSQVGPRVSGFTRAEWPRPERFRDRLIGRILWADSFGNLLTNLSRDEVGPILRARDWRISGRGWRVEVLSKTYGEGEPGQPLALFGSSGYLELAVNQGRAAERLGMKPGDPLVIRLRK